MRVLILHNRVAAGDAPDARDVLDQVEAVEHALAVLGHTSRTLACDLDLEALRRQLVHDSPDVVFNLVEGLAGHDRLLPVVPALLDALGVPYTGADTTATFLTTHKLLAKERLRAAGLPTPALLARWPPQPEGAGDVGPATAILKSVWNHGSQGLSDELVLDGGSAAELEARLATVADRLGGDCYAEEYVPGRELNLSLLAGATGPQVLPPAEIRFVDFPAAKPRIVGYAAKWQPGSFEHQHTVRSFEFAAADAPLLAEASRLALAAWRSFALRGYARVDFRVDPLGRPLILEVNTNPCLSPDAGFVAAADRAGLGFPAAVERILAAAQGSSTATVPSALIAVEARRA